MLHWSSKQIPTWGNQVRMVFKNLPGVLGASSPGVEGTASAADHVLSLLEHGLVLAAAMADLGAGLRAELRAGQSERP